LAILLAYAGLALAMPAAARAQSVGGSDSSLGLTIERVEIRIKNPSQDAALNDRVTDTIRRKIQLYPGDTFSEERIGFVVSQAKRTANVGSVTSDISPGKTGGMIVTLTVNLLDAAAAGEGGGVLNTGSPDDFPVLYDKNGTYIRAKLELLSLYYANNNAWYGRPDLMLAGNPLVQGTPAGSGYDDWVEAYVHYGLYGITPVTSNLYVYGGVSALTTGSAGDELFTDQTRSFTGVEDAYVGAVGGETDEAGNRFAFNLTAGRQRFTLANGFLIANTAANGEERAALQANARWASDLLGHARFRYNASMLEFFYVDPDELPVIDSKTTYAGVNFEATIATGLDIGATALTSPQSEFNYFGPLGAPVGTREGMQVFDARFNYATSPPGQEGAFFGGEYAIQRNENFDMDARAGWLEAGYSLPAVLWSPTVSYRLSMFSGDDSSTAAFERWDPMLSGGTGEQWVQGANHFKVVQDTNVVAHRIQARLRPHQKVELVPQLWAFFADSTTNIGGNPALSFLGDKEYGYEANLTAKFFVSRQTYIHGHVAYTWAGEGAEDALGGDADDWLSTMLFVRYAF
jgi:hypothetical protein